MVNGYRNEIWKNIEFDERISSKEVWKISNYGRLMRCMPNGEERLMKDSTLNGYYSITLKQEVNGKNTKRYTHKLVAQAFLEKKEDDLYVIHLDYDKENNHVSNLKWATKKEKEDHQQKNPVFIEAVAKKRTKYKLDEAKVRIIKRKLTSSKSKTRLKVIARQFGVSDMQIHRIKTGENWGHVKINEE